MKKFKILPYLVLAFMAITSCSKDESKVYISDNPTAPVLTTLQAGSTLTLTSATKEDSVAFAWNKADFGANLAVTYKLQFDVKGNNFKNAKTLTVKGKDGVKVKANDLNNLLLTLQTDSENPVKQEMDFRVIATVNNTNVTDVVSSTINVFVVPFFVPIVYPKLYCPGDYQVAGGYGTSDWSPATATTVASKNSDGYYEGYIYFAGPSNFKLTSAPDWGHINYGFASAGKLSTDGGAGNINVAAAGYYKVNVSVPDLTYNLKATTWGIIGDATPGGWDTDTQMAYNPSTKVWTATVSLTGGKNLKFRANAAWDLNYGLTNGKFAENGADNIPVATSGTYTVTLDLSNAPYYKYKLEKN